MTPKEKAKELIEKYLSMENALNVVDLPYMTLTIQCALIAVEEILNAITFNMYDEEEYNKVNDFWEEVKTELEKL
jgi:hypothetical protein